MSPSLSSLRRNSVLRRLWKPSLAAGAGGTATLVWWEEILLYSAEILALVTIPILAGAIYLYDILAFKARLPRRGNLGPGKKSERK